MDAVIRAASGPLKGAILRLTEADEVTIGRHSSNYLCIPDLTVSRHHCVIKPESQGYALCDLESNNGTLLNGSPIRNAVLKDGDAIGIGNTVFEFSVKKSTLAVTITGNVREENLSAHSTVQLSPDSLIGMPGEIASSKYRSREMAVLARLGTLLSPLRDAEQLARDLLQFIAEVMPADEVALLPPSITEPAASGWNRQRNALTTFRISRPIVEQVFREGAVVLSEDAETGRTVPVLAGPLVATGGVQGIVYVRSLDPARKFGRNDVEFLSAISGYIALALESKGRLAYLENENRSLREEVKLEHEMVGQCDAMRAVYKKIARIAPTDATVLIRGDTGTGKELAARAIHRNSPRAAQPFAAINCALLGQTLLESELFGHEKGSFTGAVTQKKGKLELADGGTVFLDELGELPEATQSMLLRVLQERTFHRVGGTRPIQVDIRIVAATNKDLEKGIEEKTFREDLYYRINVVSLSLPRLAQRIEDIPLLVRHFLRRASEKNKRAVTKISPQALAYLQSYAWPGNVRELENAIEHAVVFGCTDEVQPEDLPETITDNVRPAGITGMNYHEAVRDAKRQIVMNAIRQSNGNYTEAAKVLQIHPNNLHRLIRDLDLKTEVAGTRPV